ncbi:hemin import ATP-binding protein HmuV [Clostridium acetireducens DSM 10703]|jgi:iron complex transport system ATP-binding protein|uniref:Hemin import ATP-binding protein HmuV n=1 Tax=Clostridium acetireducens DSM 10703 TaxID=1121290 RepID=A0A1E8EZY2_9CLOT|nr:ABC transporter ATP-binding protein [Clostridium acetireducens]OFI06682.1 hemin import ATP-binding protein HmuV [Clostridium acetireducens DSM 10703]
MDILNIKNLQVQLDKKIILNNINLQFQKGKVYGVLGPNGSGKSTLLLSIAKIIKIKNGSIHINKKNLNKYSIENLSKVISLLSQNFQLKLPYTVEEIVFMGRYTYTKGILSKEEQNFIDNIIEEMDLCKLKSTQVTKLSGGEKQRVLLAKTLCQDTNIVLIDEGFSNMDIHYQIKFMKLLREKAYKDNKLIIFVMHNLLLAKKYCDNILLLKNGEVYNFGENEKVLTNKALKEVFNIDGKFSGNAFEIF